MKNLSTVIIFSLLTFLFIIPIYAMAQIVISDIPDKVNSEITRLNNQQLIEKDTKGKYSFIPPYEVDNIRFTVHEYVTPNSSKGYQIYATRLDTLQTMSYGHGPESEQLSYDWTEPIIASSTPKL